jgi:hypothetical protein
LAQMQGGGVAIPWRIWSAVAFGEDFCLFAQIHVGDLLMRFIGRSIGEYGPILLGAGLFHSDVQRRIDRYGWKFAKFLDAPRKMLTKA